MTTATKGYEPTTATELFNVIRKFFEESPDDSVRREQMEAWDVLTALRGPDVHEDSDAKTATTSVIRQAVLGAESAINGYAMVNGDSEQYVKTRKIARKNIYGEYEDIDRPIKSMHFFDHCARAFAVLHLDWDKVNENV